MSTYRTHGRGSEEEDREDLITKLRQEVDFFKKQAEYSYKRSY